MKGLEFLETDIIHSDRLLKAIPGSVKRSRKLTIAARSSGEKPEDTSSC